MEEPIAFVFVVRRVSESIVLTASVIEHANSSNGIQASSNGSAPTSEAVMRKSNVDGRSRRRNVDTHQAAFIKAAKSDRVSNGRPRDDLPDLPDRSGEPVCDSYYLTTLVDPDDLQNEYITWMHIRFPGVEPPRLQIFEGELL